MDTGRVDRLVDDLTAAFEAALGFYSEWKQKQKQERNNHYYRKETTTPAKESKCTLSTSLDISSHRIKATYQVGFALIGPEFARGDSTCRECLSLCLNQLEDEVAFLRQRVTAKQPGPLNLHELFQVSESTRNRCVSALVDQYRHLAPGLPIPQDLPVPKYRVSRRLEEPPASLASMLSKHKDDLSNTKPVDIDRQTAIWSTSSGPPAFQSEPPSPPPTPTEHRPDDLQSSIGAQSEIGARRSSKPKNGVFSIFCREAMSLQVDPSRPVPSRTCKCGYRWNVKLTDNETEDGDVLLKDGFRMTKRFLAKSHCDQSADDTVGEPRPGYGCVLCTSTGCAETYETVEMLRVHVNAAHTKWQMLHDRDMA